MNQKLWLKVKTIMNYSYIYIFWFNYSYILYFFLRHICKLSVAENAPFFLDKPPAAYFSPLSRGNIVKQFRHKGHKK